MENLKTIAFAAIVACANTCIVHAQPAITAPINNWSYQHHSSTPTEGYLRGAASVVQAAGQKNYMDSMAILNLQESKRRAIENSKLYVKTFIENRDALRDYRKRYAPVPPTKEEWDHIVAISLPDRLTSGQYDPQTGKVVWPHILRMDEYTAVRTRIDQLLKQRSPADSGDGSPTQRELAAMIDVLQLLLKGNVHTLTVGQYGSAQAFLKSLDYEMTFQLDTLVGNANPQSEGNVN